MRFPTPGSARCSADGWNLDSPEHEFRNAIPPGSQRPDLDSDSLRIDECSVVVFQQPASLTVSKTRGMGSISFPETAWASRQARGKRDGDVTTQCSDREWGVSLRPQWRGHAV